MYEVAKTRENPNTKELAFTVNKNFTEYVETFENIQRNLFHAKLNYRENHHYETRTMCQ